MRPIIDHWIIVDTGSTDGTQDVIRDAMAGLPGELIGRPWVDFAHNRSEALALARPHGTYSLIIDADDELTVPFGFTMSDLDSDSYEMEIVDKQIVYYRKQLVRNALEWRYRGVLHEVLDCPAAKNVGRLPILMHRIQEGSRSTDPHKYAKDATLLENALATETDPFLIARYTFYLAQSYRDCGEPAKSIDAYLRRATMGFWDQEVFVSFYQAGRLMETLNRDPDEILATYQRATDTCPSRAEAAHAASRFCRAIGRNKQGYEIAKPALTLAASADGLFVEPWVYDYGLLDEHAVNAYWAGHYRECQEACFKLLGRDFLPVGYRERIVANARFALDKLPGERNLGTKASPGFIEQHALAAPQDFRSRLKNTPRVMIAILAKQKEAALPLYLECIEALDYPKASIVLYIRTNNNTDRTEEILRAWISRVGIYYAAVEFDFEDVPINVQQFRVHEWNATRFRVLGHIRNVSLRRTLDHGCDFYFVADVDNFVRPCTLRELVALDLPIVAPFLRSIDPRKYYANYHAEIDANGYYKECDQYHWILNRWVRGVIELPLVHCTYMVRADVICNLSYQDATDRFEYVVFAESTRNARVPQYLDNRQVYGYVVFDESSDLYVADGFTKARALLVDELQQARPQNEWPNPKQDRLVALKSSAQVEQKRLKTLVFCTSFVTTAGAWQGRYRRWLEAIKCSGILYDTILIVDDGSPVLPDWPDATITTDTVGVLPAANLLIYHFQQHLGRRALFDFPGWYRSFAFAGRYAQQQGYQKIIHIESDTFLIGERIQRYVNELSRRWIALWCPLYGGFPETALQIIAGEAVNRFAQIERTHPHKRLIGRQFELQLPFDIVEKRFVGSRYGEYLPFIPGNAEYACQVASDRGNDYYWWMRNHNQSLDSKT